MAENPTLDTTATIDALRARVAALEADIAAWNLCADHQPDRWLPPDGVCTLCEARDEHVRARALEAERDAIVAQCGEAERALNRAWQALDAIAAGPQGDDSFTAQGHRECVEAARAVLAGASSQPHAEAIRVLVKLRKHLCPSCDLDDTEWAEIEGFNRGIDAAVAALRAEGEGDR